MKKLNIENLSASDNIKITDLNHLQFLKICYISNYNCGVDQIVYC